MKRTISILLSIAAAALFMPIMANADQNSSSEIQWDGNGRRGGDRGGRGHGGGRGGDRGHGRGHNGGGHNGGGHNGGGHNGGGHNGGGHNGGGHNGGGHNGGGHGNGHGGGWGNPDRSPWTCTYVGRNSKGKKAYVRSGAYYNLYTAKRRGYQRCTTILRGCTLVSCIRW